MATAPLPRTALLAGATGLIGRALLDRLLQDKRYSQVHVLARREVQGGAAGSGKLQVHRVDFANLPSRLPAVDDVYIALGTTIGVAGSREAFRAVDFDFVVNTARAARAAGARHLAVVSSLGADADSRVFYNRVKGEMQATVARLGFASLTFVQPSLLLDDRAALGQPVRRGEVWASRLLGPFMRWVPASVRPIEAEAVAAAMLQAMLEARPGVHILVSADMQAAGRTR